VIAPAVLRALAIAVLTYEPWLTPYPEHRRS